MSILESDQALRPAPKGLKGLLQSIAIAAAPFAFGVLRRVKPIFRLGSVYVVTRYDDVREAFRSSHALDTPYKANIDVLTGGERLENKVASPRMAFSPSGLL